MEFKEKVKNKIEQFQWIEMFINYRQSIIRQLAEQTSKFQLFFDLSKSKYLWISSMHCLVSYFKVKKSWIVFDYLHRILSRQI